MTPCENPTKEPAKYGRGESYTRSVNVCAMKSRNTRRLPDGHWEEINMYPERLSGWGPERKGSSRAKAHLAFISADTSTIPKIIVKCTTARPEGGINRACFYKPMSSPGEFYSAVHRTLQRSSVFYRIGQMPWTLDLELLPYGKIVLHVGVLAAKQRPPRHCVSRVLLLEESISMEMATLVVIVHKHIQNREATTNV